MLRSGWKITFLTLSIATYVEFKPKYGRRVCNASVYNCGNARALARAAGPCDCKCQRSELVRSPKKHGVWGDSRKEQVRYSSVH